MKRENTRSKKHSSTSVATTESSKNSSNFGSEMFTNDTEVVTVDVKPGMINDLGEEYGFAQAIERAEGQFMISYCATIICPHLFKSVDEVKKYMKKNPYSLIPIMAAVYTEKTNRIKNNKNQ